MALNNQDPELRGIQDASRLVLKYAGFYTYETMYSILGPSQCLIDLRACMAKPNLNVFYESLFSWALTFAHQCKFNTGANAITRHEYLRKLRIIASQVAFRDIKIEDLMYLPDRPVAKLRKPSKKKVRYDDKLDEFALVGGGTIQTTSDTTTPDTTTAESNGEFDDSVGV